MFSGSFRENIWDEDSPHARFLQQLRRKALDDLIGNEEWLASLRYNYPEVRRLSKQLGRELTERGLSLERLVLGEPPEQKSEDPADGGESGDSGDGVVEVAATGEDDADRARDLLREGRGGLGKLGDAGGARRADEHDHPLVKLHRDLLLKNTKDV